MQKWETLWVPIKMLSLVNIHCCTSKNKSHNQHLPVFFWGFQDLIGHNLPFISRMRSSVNCNMKSCFSGLLRSPEILLFAGNTISKQFHFGISLFTCNKNTGNTKLIKQSLGRQANRRNSAKVLKTLDFPLLRHLHFANRWDSHKQFER